MQPKSPLLQKCFDYLESLPHSSVTLESEPYFSSEVLADGKLVIKIGNKTTSYICEIKTGITNDSIEQIAAYFSKLGERLARDEKPLLVTKGISKLVADRLIGNNIEFVDVDGNIYLNSSEIYILVSDRDKKEDQNKSLEIAASALQVMYAMVIKPKTLAITSAGTNSRIFSRYLGTPLEHIKSLNQEYDRLNEIIANISGVTASTVRNTINKLEDLKYITRKSSLTDRKHPLFIPDPFKNDVAVSYKIIDYLRLLERWELGYTERLRAKLLLGTFTPIGKRDFSGVRNLIEKYAEELDYFIGGELAASVMIDYLRPIGATLHLNKNSDIRQIAVKLKLKPDPNGSITFLQTFGNPEYQLYEFGKDRQRLAHPLLIHAELVHTENSRLKETAQIIYDRYIEPLI